MTIEEQLKSVDDLILSSYWLTPLNLSEEREKFLANSSQNPQIRYPEIPKALLKDQLQKLEKIEISTQPKNLSEWLLLRKKKELELTLSLLIKRETPEFGEASCLLYECTFNAETIAGAHLDAASPLPFESNENKTSAEIVTGITEYLAEYGVADWSITLSDQTDFYFRVKSLKKQILIGKRFNWDFTDFDCMLAHEIDGHVIRAVNAEKQTHPLLKKPLPFYIKTEEGLASYLGDYYSKTAEINRKHHALKYLAGHLAVTHSFKDVFEFLVGSGFTPDLAFQRTFRLKRGISDTTQAGCFGKEAMYYEGMFEVKQFFENGGDIKKLYTAKVGLADIPFIDAAPDVIIPSRIQSPSAGH